MASNAKTVQERYTDPMREEARFGYSRANGMEAHYTEKTLAKLVKSTDGVLEVGCATGRYGFFLADKCHSYLGVDLSPAHVNFFNERIAKTGAANLKVQLGDAMRLDGIADEGFDMVLVLGPMYHLPPEERDAAFAESKRVCKTGGSLVYAYINTLGVYAWASAAAPEHYPNAHANDCLLHLGINDIHPDLFFFTSPEAIAADAERNGLTVVKHVGVDFTLFVNVINNLPEERLAAWMELTDRMSESPSCVGLSNHALMLCRKAE